MPIVLQKTCHVFLLRPKLLRQPKNCSCSQGFCHKGRSGCLSPLVVCMVVQVLLQPHMMSRLNVCCQVCNLLEVPLQRRSKISRLKMTNFPSLLAERSSRCQNSVKKFVLPRLCSCRSCWTICPTQVQQLLMLVQLRQWWRSWWDSCLSHTAHQNSWWTYRFASWSWSPWLGGENTLRNLELQLGVRGRTRELSAPLHVSGVGRLAQTAETAVTVDFDLPMPALVIEQGTSSSFTTPIFAWKWFAIAPWFEITAVQTSHFGHTWSPLDFAWCRWNWVSCVSWFTGSSVGTEQQWTFDLAYEATFKPDRSQNCSGWSWKVEWTASEFERPMQGDQNSFACENTCACNWLSPKVDWTWRSPRSDMGDWTRRWCRCWTIAKFAKDTCTSMHENVHKCQTNANWYSSDIKCCKTWRCDQCTK